MRILCAVLMVCLSSGCSTKGLSEGTAKKELQKRIDKKTVYMLVPLGRVGPHCKREYTPGTPENDDESPSKDVYQQIVQIAGYVTITPDGPDFRKVSLTDKGKHAENDERLNVPPYKTSVAGCDFTDYSFQAAQAEIARIVDIQRTQDAWEVRFTWRWKLSELGQALHMAPTNT